MPEPRCNFRPGLSCSGIQLLSLGSKQWIPANERTGMTIEKNAGKTIEKNSGITGGRAVSLLFLLSLTAMEGGNVDNAGAIIDPDSLVLGSSSLL